MEHVGEVVAQRRLAVAVALRDAQRERLGEPLVCVPELAAAGVLAGEVVERRDPDRRIGEPDRQLETAFEVVPATADQTEDVVGLCGWAVRFGLLGERERLQRERARFLEPTMAPRHAAEVRADDRGLGTECQCLLIAAFGELPVSTALVDPAELVLEPPGVRFWAVGGGGVVCSERFAVLAAQRPHIPYSLVQEERVGVAERERGLVVRDRFGARRERPCTVTSGRMSDGGGLILPRQLVVVSGDRGFDAPGTQRVRDPVVQCSPTGRPKALLRQRPQLLVPELVRVLERDHQAARNQFIERDGDLVLGASARRLDDAGVERSADQRGRAEHLPRRLARRLESRLERLADATR